MERAERGWESADSTNVKGGATRTVFVQIKDEPGRERETRAFVISGSRREPLPLPGSFEDRRSSLSQFLFSPDEGALLAQRWFSSTNGQAFVYRRISGLRYVLTHTKSLEEQIATQFGGPSERPVTEVPNHLQLQCWLPGGELLASCYYGTHKVGIHYQVILEPRTGRLRSWKLLKEGQALGWPEKFEHYPQTRLRPITWQELENWSDAELTYAINEMYARRGYGFPDQPKIKALFAKLGFSTDSKRKVSTIESLMWPTERQNLQLLTRRRLRKPQRNNG